MSDNKNLDPTDHKIKDARKKGQIAVSKDLAHLATLVTVGEVTFLTEALWRESIHSLMEIGFTSVGKPFQTSLVDMLSAAGLFLLIVFCITFLLCSIVGFAAHWGQFGVLIAPEVLTQGFDKLNPVNGFKNMFSAQKLVELFETAFKAALIGLTVYLLAREALPTIIHFAAGQPKDAYAAFIELLRTTFHVLVGLCLCIGIIDFAIKKHFWKKQLMMDMEEVKREFKELEGDMLMKSHRKQLGRQWLNESPVAKTSDANAVVVNPTHFAIAMFYDPEEAMVPVVLAKGKDEIAAAMIQRAKECGIPVIRHVWLARTLYATCKPDTVVPKASYDAVAYVYAVVYQLLALGQADREVELEAFGEPPETHRPG